MIISFKLSTRDIAKKERVIINMEFINILNKWAAFSNYDPNQTKFNISTYWIAQGNKTIGKLQKYDVTGALSILYVKELCKRVLKEFGPRSYLEIIEDPSAYLEAREMW